jgi:hypothetical protein
MIPVVSEMKSKYSVTLVNPAGSSASHPGIEKKTDLLESKPVCNLLSM